MSHPYRGMPAQQFWSQAMSDQAPGLVDPVSNAPRIGVTEPVGTLGSCFAQHIARHLSASGGHYFVAETAPEALDAQAARERQFGVFSARYGNVYTVRQAVQLFDRAFGHFVPLASAWALDERWVDAFRPQVEPGGYASIAALEADRATHLACVRRVFLESRWIVFTLGLTEAWRDRRDGAVFPIAPGVAGGHFDAEQHERVNFGIDEVRADLDAFIERLLTVNPDCQIVLTVSPVPLAATFEPRHVLVSTTSSKAALRVAADEAERRHAHVHYFPSYEVITSPAAGGRYYADDLRQVTDLGVQHVMRLFSRHYIDGNVAAPAGYEAASALAGQAGDIVCDEEVIERAMRALR